MKDRIKQIRESVSNSNGKKISQSEFAERCHVSRDVIANYEYGRVEPTDIFITYVCREFGINEDWLRTGEGDMFATSTREDEIAKITAQMFRADESDFRWQLQKLISQMSDEQIKVFHDFAIMLAESINK